MYPHNHAAATEDTVNIEVADSLRSAIDNAMYLADTLSDEKHLPQETKTIKETLKENLAKLKGKVGRATLNIPNYNKVVQALLRYMVGLKNERITREYLSRFTDESLNACCIRSGAWRPTSIAKTAWRSLRIPMSVKKSENKKKVVT